ncbi:MAG TPA: hypothetical protein DCR14_20570 [Acidimicrobiaceae bacterium]|nr:hypothetical protein [Acidimicrobiaceae bacterium]
MRTRLIALAVVASVPLVACSVVDEQGVERIDPQYGLDDTLPPTTTTIATTTTEAATTTSGLDTTTTAAVQTEEVLLYFIASGQLTPFPQNLPAPVATPQLLAALLEGPPAGELGTGLRTALPAGAIIRVVPDSSGIAQVQLPPDFFEAVPVGDQRLVIGQLVVTLLSNLRGVGQVAFNQSVTKPTGELVPPGQPLTYGDYDELLGTRTITPVSSLPIESITTTSSTSTSSTVAP